jgi:hypothetical protein
MHSAARAFVTNLTHMLRPHTVIEYGSRDINGNVRNIILNSNPDATYTGLDLYEGPNVDIITDCTTYTHPVPADLILCLGVLEHTPLVQEFAHSAYRNLRPGGVYALCAAGPRWRPHSTHDGRFLPDSHDEYYCNVTTTQIKQTLQTAGFRNIQVIELNDDIYATAER